MLGELFGKPGRPKPRAPSLVARVRLSSYYDSEEQSLVFRHDGGWIGELGFGEAGSFWIIHHAPTAEPVAHSHFYQDKFVTLCPGDTHNALGCAEIKEDYVYDFHYRSEIDFTGLRLDLMLRPSAFEEYRRFIGSVRTPSDISDPIAWHGDLLLSIPSPMFDFPPNRGSAAPYPPPGAKVRELRTIKSFHFDKIDIIKSRPRYETGDTPATEMGDPTPENVLSLRQ